MTCRGSARSDCRDDAPWSQRRLCRGGQPLPMPNLLPTPNLLWVSNNPPRKGYGVWRLAKIRIKLTVLLKNSEMLGLAIPSVDQLLVLLAVAPSEPTAQPKALACVTPAVSYAIDSWS